MVSKEAKREIIKRNHLIIVQHNVYGYSYERISNLHNVSVNTVKNIITEFNHFKRKRISSYAK